MVEPLNTKTLTAADLVEIIAHKEQIGIWANEIATAISLGDMLKEDWSFDDSVDLEREIVAQLRDVLSSAFSHPAYDIATLITTQQQEIERLRGLQPEFPPYPPDGDGLPRFGLRWNGPSEPLSVPMEDGYWTPYHLASLYRRHCNAAEQELSEVSRAIGSVRWMDLPDGGDVSLGEQVNRMRADLEGAESRVLSLEEENARLREALKPFGEYLDEVKFDLDNQGRLLPDDTEPGWTYLTAGDFRRARNALKVNGNG